MSKSDLKAAMDSLQIGKPFRLPAKQHQFTAPTMVADPTVVPTATGDVIDTRVPVATLVSRRTASDQDSSVNLETHSAPKLHVGYTRIPNSILMRMAEGEFIKSEMQILLVIARFTISFQKRHAPLSKSVLERQTGLRGPAVLQAISSLLEKKVIEKIPGDQYRPNQLGLVFTDDFDFFDRKKTPVALGTQVQESTSAPPETSAPVAPETQAVVARGTHFKDTQTISKNFSLPDLPQNTQLHEYFENLKPQRKRVSEIRAYESLRKEYSDEKIQKSFLALRRTDPGWNKYHSPMAYLAVSIEQVLADSITAKSGESERLKKFSECELEKCEDEEWRQREASFLNTFQTPELQKDAIQKYTAGMTFGGEIMRRGVAISRWWDSIQ